MYSRLSLDEAAVMRILPNFPSSSTYGEERRVEKGDREIGAGFIHIMPLNVPMVRREHTVCFQRGHLLE